MRKILLFFLFVLLFLISSNIFAFEFPQPQGWVNDFANVINQEYKDKLNALISELEQKTSAEIAVVTVESISPYDEKEYARQVFDNWKIGKKDKDNGILVLLAIKERLWRIETGYGVEGILPDGLCGEIGRNYMVPYFKEGNYAQGLYNGVAAISKIVALNSNVALSSLSGANLSNGVNFAKGRQPKSDLFVNLFAFFFFLVWNLPWPIFIGLPFTIIFALVFFQISFFSGSLVIAGYFASLIIRFLYWKRLPPGKRSNFFKGQNYGGRFSGGGGFGGSGSGGFGGGGGGGGGAGGRF
ncbi:MAG: TPM domain-containing protein [Candidatus Omnitrophica bacterium]|nr:TPM domain-containing protein [Candidatus Omnitrophota bacterium]